MHEVEVTESKRPEESTPWILGRLYEGKYGGVYLSTDADRLFLVAGKPRYGVAGQSWTGKHQERFGVTGPEVFKLLPPGTRVTITVGE